MRVEFDFKGVFFEVFVRYSIFRLDPFHLVHGGLEQILKVDVAHPIDFIFHFRQEIRANEGHLLVGRVDILNLIFRSWNHFLVIDQNKALHELHQFSFVEGGEVRSALRVIFI